MNFNLFFSLALSLLLHSKLQNQLDIYYFYLLYQLLMDNDLKYIEPLHNYSFCKHNEENYLQTYLLDMRTEYLGFHSLFLDNLMFDQLIVKSVDFFI